MIITYTSFNITFPTQTHQLSVATIMMVKDSSAFNAGHCISHKNVISPFNHLI